MSWLDGLISSPTFKTNGTLQTQPNCVNLTGAGVTSTAVSGQLNVTFTGSGCSADANYLVLAADPTLPNAYVIAGSDSIAINSDAFETVLSCVFGTTSSTVCAGNDSRLSDPRTPTAHTHAVLNGGTGQTTYAAGDMLYASATDTLSKLALPGDGYILATTNGSLEWSLLSGASGLEAEISSGATSISPLYGSAVNTVCQGNDPRVLRSSGWWPSGVAPTTTAASSSSVTITIPSVKPGHPVRVLDLVPTVSNPGGSVSNNTVKSAAITGVTSSKIDVPTGVIFVKPVLTSGTTWTLSLYTNETCAAGYLVATTSSFDTSASPGDVVLTVTAANGSGLGGTITVTRGGAVWNTMLSYLNYWKTAIVTANSGTAITIAGQALSTEAGAIVEVWIGDPRLVVQYPLDIPGTYGTTSTTAFASKLYKSPKWKLPPAVLVQISGQSGTADTGASEPTIQLKIGANSAHTALAMSATANNMTNTVVTMTSKYGQIFPGDLMELAVVAGTNADAKDLCADALFVLSDGYREGAPAA